jgi:hypothetical protein
MEAQREDPTELVRADIGAIDAEQEPFYQHINKLRHPAIKKVNSITEACEAHSDPDLRVTFQPELQIPRQSELETFTRSFEIEDRAKRIFTFRDQPAAAYEPTLRAALEEVTAEDPSLLADFAGFASGLINEFVEARGLQAGGFASDMAMFKMGDKPLWHLDNFDPDKEKLQFILVIAGSGGSMITTGDEYETAEFEKHRNLLHTLDTALEQQREQIVAMGGESAWNAQRTSIEFSQQMIRQSTIGSLRTIVPVGGGIATDPQTAIIFKAGEGLHANGLSDGNRLVLALSEE